MCSFHSLASCNYTVLLLTDFGMDLYLSRSPIARFQVLMTSVSSYSKAAKLSHSHHSESSSYSFVPVTFERGSNESILKKSFAQHRYSPDPSKYCHQKHCCFSEVLRFLVLQQCKLSNVLSCTGCKSHIVELFCYPCPISCIRYILRLRPKCTF